MASGGEGAPTWAEFTVELGHNFSRHRVALGLSQERVARMAGVEPYTYQKYEMGQSRPGGAANPTVQTVAAIGQVLEVRLCDLLPRNVPRLALATPVGARPPRASAIQVASAQVAAPQTWHDAMVAFGHNLARVRGDLGLSQERVAWMAGLAPYTYQKFEKGESRPGTPANPQLRNALAISQALDVWLWDLLPALPDLTQGR